MDNKKVMDIDFTIKDKNFEIASMYDADLMRIRAFATTEGRNLNGTIFPRENLLIAHRSFIDKPVIIVPSKDNSPTGHAFDFKKGTFDMAKRKHVGHITNAYPVIVDEKGNIHEVYDYEYEKNAKDLPDGELRIVVDIVIYKNYFTDIAERLEFLHKMGELAFSMEALVSAISTDDGGKVCTDIAFTGLAIVDNPAFVNSKSISVSEKEEEVMNFEEMYNAEKVKNETLISEKATVQSELDKAKEDLATVKEEMANVKTELAEANATIETLKPYKEQVEKSEKEKLGQERLAKLEKLGVKDLDVAELAEKSKEEFADMLVEAAEKYVPEVATKKVEGVPQEDVAVAENSKEVLRKFLGLK